MHKDLTAPINFEGVNGIVSFALIIPVIGPGLFCGFFCFVLEFCPILALIESKV